MNVSAITEIGSKIVSLGYKTGVIQNAPKILLGLGLGGIGVGVVKTCKSTLAAQKIIEEHKEQRAIIEEATQIFANENAGAIYPEKNRDIATLYFNTGKKLVKEYAVGVGLITLGVVSICCSFNILNNRYLDSVAAYNALQAAYKKYRKRVRDEYGDEVDKQFAQGVYKSDNIVKNAKGRELSKETEFDFDADSIGSPYLTVFNEETSTAYVKPSKYFGMSARANRLAMTEMNMYFLKQQQDSLTERLRCEGVLLLNDALAALGMKRIGYIYINGRKVKAGNIGWTYPTDAEGNYIGPGDGCVNFGVIDFDKAAGSENWTIISSVNDEKHPYIANWKTGDIVIDFNVDGDISDYLATKVSPFRRRSSAKLTA